MKSEIEELHQLPVLNFCSDILDHAPKLSKPNPVADCKLQNAADFSLDCNNKMKNSIGNNGTAVNSTLNERIGLQRKDTIRKYTSKRNVFRFRNLDRVFSSFPCLNGRNQRFISNTKENKNVLTNDLQNSKNDDVKVIYISDKFRFRKNRRKHIFRNNRNEIDECNATTCINLDDSLNRSATKISNRQHRRKNPRKIDRFCSCTSFPVKLPKCKFPLHPRCNCDVLKHYDLTGLPEHDIAKFYYTIMAENYLRDDQNADFCKDEGILVSPSCFSVSKKGGGDAAVMTSNHELKVWSDKAIDVNFEHGKEKSSRTMSQYCKCLKDTKADQTQNVCFMQKACTYFLIGFAIVVWSPCLLIIMFCWLITFPLRPHHLIFGKRNHSDRNDKKRKFNRGLARNIYDRFFANSRITRVKKDTSTSTTIGDSEKRLNKIDIDKSQQDQIHPSIHFCFGTRRAKSIPNRKKTYTLYYRRKRGWFIKSEKVKAKKDKYISTVDKIPGKSHKTRFAKLLKINSLSKRVHPTQSETKSMPKSFCDCKPMPISKLSLRRKASCKRVFCRCGYNSIYANGKTCGKSKKIENLAKKFKRISQTSYKKKQISLLNRLRKCAVERWNTIKATVIDIEAQLGKDDVKCNEMFIHTRRNKPCFFVYRCWPSLYPHLLTIIRLITCTCHGILFCISICIWCPLLCCCYLCSEIFFKCFC